MSSKAIQLDSNLSFVEPKGKLHMDTNGFMRSEYHCNSDYSQLVDVHSEHGAIISYLRIDSRDVERRYASSVLTLSATLAKVVTMIQF